MEKAGLADKDILRMKNGDLTAGKAYQIHPKIPIDGGGTNDSSNLILIKNEPYHKAITNYQNQIIGGIKPGESRTIDFPIPECISDPPVPR